MEKKKKTTRGQEYIGPNISNDINLTGSMKEDVHGDLMQAAAGAPMLVITHPTRALNP